MFTLARRNQAPRKKLRHLPTSTRLDPVTPLCYTVLP